MTYIIKATSTTYQYIQIKTVYSGDDIKSHINKVAKTLGLINVSFEEE